MGYWKNKMMEQQEHYDWAKSILIRVHALQECEAHEDAFDGPAELEEAYKYVNTRITSGEIKLKGGQTRRDVTNLIKSVYDDNSTASECPSCAKNLAG